MDRLVGFHTVREALRARRRELLRLRYREGLRRRELSELLELARAAGIPAQPEGPDSLGTGLEPGARAQGLVLEAGPLPQLGLDSLLATPDATAGGQAEGRPGRRLVLLDGVEDPQNLGAIARVAEASGAHGLLLAARRSPPLSPAVSRASAGAIEHLPVYRATNLRRSLTLLREAGYWTLGADPACGEDLFDTPDRLWAGDLVLVFGAEGRGLRPGLVPLLDHRLRIPLAGRVSSLNVATAAAVVLFEAARRARAPMGPVAPSAASARN